MGAPPSNTVIVPASGSGTPLEDLVTDVVLVPSPYAHGAGTPTRKQEFFRASYHIHDSVWLVNPEPDLIEQVYQACTPPGKNFAPTPQFGFPYGFLRRHAPQHEPYRFDPDSRLLAAISLSRLIHPTSIGFVWAARIIDSPTFGRRIVPATISSLNRSAFVLDPSSDWLIPTDVPNLRSLVAAYHAGAHPKRVAAAMWHREFAARAHYVDQRLPSLVTGLESLVHINGERDPNQPKRFAGSTRVFRQRCSQLGAMLGVPHTSESALHEMYELRSGVVHGQVFGGLDPKTLQQVSTAEILLSTVLKESLASPAFASHFATDSALQRVLSLS